MRSGGVRGQRRLGGSARPPNPSPPPCTTPQYAQWEEQQKDFRRARSVWERGLDCDYRNVSLWLK